MVKVRFLKFVHYVANSQAGQSCRLKLLHFEPIFKLQLPNKLLQFNGKSYFQGLTIMSSCAWFYKLPSLQAGNQPILMVGGFKA